jgi:hypothetical protein
MARIATAFAVLGIAGLAACSTYDPYYSSTPNPNPPTAAVTPAPVVVVPAAPVVAVPATSAAYRTGMGTVESVSRVNAATSASTGASSATYPAYRLSIRMDDGSVQTIDQDNRAFMVGDRVEVTSGGRVVRR